MASMRGGFPPTPLFVVTVLLIGMAFMLRNVLFHPGSASGAGDTVSIVDKLADAEDMQLGEHVVADATDPKCNHFSCFDVYRCGAHPRKMLGWTCLPF